MRHWAINVGVKMILRYRWWDGQEISIQSNLPQWMHISKDIDDDLIYYLELYEEKDGCDLGIFVIAIPPEDKEKGENTNFQ